VEFVTKNPFTTENIHTGRGGGAQGTMYHFEEEHCIHPALPDAKPDHVKQEGSLYEQERKQ
jgi:hypothetical protein